MIPFDISGTVRIATTVRSNSATVKAVANRLATMLDEKDCSEVYIEGNRVRFHNKWIGGTLRWGARGVEVFDSSLITNFGTGTFDIEAAIDGIAIRFSLSLARLWLVVGVMVAGMLLTSPQPMKLLWIEVWPSPLLLLLGFVILYYAITWGRVWFWLRRGLSGVSALSMTP